MALTVTESYSVQSPNGNSLAVFIEAQSGEIYLKDVNGKVASLSAYFLETPYRYNADYPNAIEPVLGGNYACTNWGTIGGGKKNVILGDPQFSYETIGGGYCNTACQTSTIGGGIFNCASNISTVSGGTCNQAFGAQSSIGGGIRNTNLGWFSVIGGGASNSITEDWTTIAGGACNVLSGQSGTISGGCCNIVSGNSATISGGRNNTSSGCVATIGGGSFNLASSCFSSILGGRNNNTATFSDAMIVGSCITANRACTLFANNLSIMNIPTSDAGLPSGSVYRIGSALCIVP